MSNIRYICLSDMHFGQHDSILTNLRTNLSGIDLSKPSPAMVALCNGLRDMIKANDKQDTPPTLILAGDILEIALTPMNNASAAFEQFIRHILPKEEENLFDKIVFIPGNHDHHMWELARETQYVEHLKEVPPDSLLTPPWHDSRMFEKEDKKPLPRGYYLSNLIHRAEYLKNFEVSVAYPNFGLYNNDRCAIFHHGHFVEEIYHLMSDLARMFFPDKKQPSATVGDIEAENFAWIDFFWSAMGRSGKVGPLIENIYISLSVEKARDKLLKNLTRGLIRKHGFWWLRLMRKPLEFILQKTADAIVTRERSKGGGKALSDEAEQGLKNT